ncbi:MAG: HAMP domain-containing protein [Desulfobulbaceae bacterium]|nr:HAMP domain-containing protein [Desulfobulbaceae bacterium]
MFGISRTTKKPIIFSFIKIPIPAGNELNSKQDAKQSHRAHWILISVVDESFLLAGMTRYTPTFIFCSLLLTLACVAIAYFVSWSIARPVVSLGKAARKIHDGDLSARATIFTRDEMGDFGNLFNNMASQLETSRNMQH